MKNAKNASPLPAGRTGARREILAGDNPFRIEVCECGALHVTMGHVTVRMAPDSCELLTANLLSALRELERRRGTVTH